jgi:hypothetical protein
MLSASNRRLDLGTGGARQRGEASRQRIRAVDIFPATNGGKVRKVRKGLP